MADNAVDTVLRDWVLHRNAYAASLNCSQELVRDYARIAEAWEDTMHNLLQQFRTLFGDAPRVVPFPAYWTEYPVFPDDDKRLDVNFDAEAETLRALQAEHDTVMRRIDAVRDAVHTQKTRELQALEEYIRTLEGRAALAAGVPEEDIMSDDSEACDDDDAEGSPGVPFGEPLTTDEEEDDAVFEEEGPYAPEKA